MGRFLSDRDFKHDPCHACNMHILLSVHNHIKIFFNVRWWVHTVSSLSTQVCYITQKCPSQLGVKHVNMHPWPIVNHLYTPIAQQLWCMCSSFVLEKCKYYSIASV